MSVHICQNSQYENIGHTKWWEEVGPWGLHTAGGTLNWGNLHFRGQFGNTNKFEDANSVF